MKTLHRFKKVIRNTLCSIICASFFVVSSITPAKADSPPTTTTYGYWSTEVIYPNQDGFSFGYGVFGVSIPITTGSGFTLTYRFNKAYTGTITVGVTASTNWYLLNDYVSLEGGWFQSFPNKTNTNITKSFSIHVDHSEGFTLCLIDSDTDTFANNTVSITFSYNGMVHENTIGGDVDGIKTAVDAYLPSMNNTLSDIYNEMQKVNQTLGQPNIYGSLTEAVELIANFVGSDLDDYLTIIKSGLVDSNNTSYLDSINNTLSSINTFISNIDSNTDGIESSLASILTAIQNIQTHDYSSTLSTISSRLSSIYSSIITIQGSLNSYLHTNLNIPFWQIPVWTWVKSNSYTSGPNGSISYDSRSGVVYSHINATLANNTFDQSRSFRINLNEPYIIVWGSTVIMNHAGAGLFGYPVYSITPSTGSMSDYITYTDGTGTIYVPGYYTNYVMFNMHDKIPSTYGLNSSVLVEFEFTQDFYIQALYIGPVHNMPDEIASMCHLEYNNTYTQLLQQIANGIGNISIQQVNENNTNINSYNNYQTQINNVENNYYSQFNQIETNIENNNTFDFTGLTNDGVSVYNNLFTNMYSIPLVKWPVLITLLGLVIVIILG